MIVKMKKKKMMTVRRLGPGRMAERLGEGGTRPGAQAKMGKTRGALQATLAILMAGTVVVDRMMMSGWREGKGGRM